MEESITQKLSINKLVEHTAADCPRCTSKSELLIAAFVRDIQSLPVTSN